MKPDVQADQVKAQILLMLSMEDIEDCGDEVAELLEVLKGVTSKDEYESFINEI